MEKNEVEELRSVKENLESDLQKAAEIGKSLLEENSELKDKIEQLIKQYSKKLEESEQETYALQLKFESKVSTENWYKEEIAQLKRDLTKQHDESVETLEAEKNSQISKLQRKVNELQTELDQSQNACEQLQSQVGQLETLLHQKLNQTADVTSRSFDMDEVAQLQQDIIDLQDENTKLKSQGLEDKTEIQKRIMELDALRQRLTSKDEEIEEIQCQASSYAVSLDRARSEIQELKEMVETVRVGSENRREKGNSIFSEVEDRRVDAEMKLISLKNRCDSLELINNNHAREKQKMKTQIMMLLQLSRGGVDSDRIGQLESQLSQARTEKAELQDQIYTLEKKVKSYSGKLQDLVSRKDCDTSQYMKGNGECDGEFAQYLITMIKAKEQEIENLGCEMRDQERQLLETKNEKFKVERKLYDTESEREKMRNKCLRLQLKIEELQMKYDPEVMKEKAPKQKIISEKIPLADEVVIKENICNISTMSNVTLMSTADQRRVTLDDSVFYPDNPAKSTHLPLQPVPDSNVSPSSPKSEFPQKPSVAREKSVTIAESVTVLDSHGEVRASKLLADNDRENIKNNQKSGQQHKPKGRRMPVKETKKCETVDMVNDCNSQ